VAATERNGVRLIGVVFGGRTGKSRDMHMMSLLNKQFSKMKPIHVRSAPLPSLPAPRPAVPKLRLTAKAPTPPSAPLTTTKKQPTQWVIQVGSYTRRVSAYKAAIKARRLAPEILGRKAAKLSISEKGGLALWRVRFEQLDEDQAREACAALFVSVKACIAIPADSTANS